MSNYNNSSTGTTSNSNSTNNHGRFRELVQQLPPVTVGIILLCTLFYGGQIVLLLFFQYDVLPVMTMVPNLIIKDPLHQGYRMLTSVFFHTNLFHLGMNMLSVSTLGTILEQRLGSFRLVFTIGWSILITSSIHVLLAATAYAGFQSHVWWYQSSVGYSGILFYQSVLESYSHPTISTTRTLMGYSVTIPSYLSPWILLILIQIMLPQVSFVGHLSGILAGTLEYSGVVDPLLLLQEPYLVHWEASLIALAHQRRHYCTGGLVALFFHTTQYISVAHSDGPIRRPPSRSSTARGCLGGGGSIGRLVSTVFQFFRNVLETIIVILCGPTVRDRVGNTAIACTTTVSNCTTTTTTRSCCCCCCWDRLRQFREQVSSRYYPSWNTTTNNTTTSNTTTIADIEFHDTTTRIRSPEYYNGNNHNTNNTHEITAASYGRHLVDDNDNTDDDNDQESIPLIAVGPASPASASTGRDDDKDKGGADDDERKALIISDIL